MGWTAEIWENSRERLVTVKFGFGGVGLGLGLGFLRWWSLIRSWNLSAVRVSSGVKVVVVGAVSVLLFASSS